MIWSRHSPPVQVRSSPARTVLSTVFLSFWTGKEDKLPGVWRYHTKTFPIQEKNFLRIALMFNFGRLDSLKKETAQLITFFFFRDKEV